jgi:autotransporter-associated beta strand protein
VEFWHSSTAGSGTFTNNGGTTLFIDSATAANATLIANGGLDGTGGGLIQFIGGAGGTARMEVFGNGSLDISNNGELTTGSIEGTGFIFLGAFNLTVGSNNLSTTFSGVIQDGGINGGTGGSLTKSGKGKLTLSKASTYTGSTTVSKGTLLVTNKTGSATGTGAVQVQAGTLGGTGKISGAVTVASGTKAAILAPGSGSKPGTLTIVSALTFNSHGTYKIDLNSATVTADKVVANGVTINSGALVSIADLGSGMLTTGTVFTVIDNTAATPIAGTFSNLVDGSTLVIGSNTYKANYEGGTGNDLTLTVQ